MRACRIASRTAREQRSPARPRTAGAAGPRRARGRAARPSPGHPRGRYAVGRARRAAQLPGGPGRPLADHARLGADRGALRPVRHPAGMGTGSRRLPRPLTRAGRGDRAAGPATGRRRRRPGHRARPQRLRREAAGRGARDHRPVHDDGGRDRPHLRLDAVLRAQRRGCVALLRRGVRRRRGHPGRRPVDDVPPGDASARTPRRARRGRAGLGTVARRVRRHDHVRRQLPRHHPDHALADLHPAPERPAGRPHGQHGAARGLGRRPRPPPQPMADPPVTTGLASSGLAIDVTVPGRVTATASAGPGQVVALIRPNGGGQTSLLRTVAGLVPHEGTVAVVGRPWTGPPVRERPVGMAFQDQLLFPHLSALDNVAFGPRSRGVARDDARRQAQEWLDRFAVGDLAGRKPRQLSGGQAQRVSIARALVTHPRLLLLDEPFAGLDVGVASALRVELARHLASYDGVSLLVTHEAIDALTLADVVWVLDEGRLVQVGPPREVAAQPLTGHVARLVGLNVLEDEGRFLSFSPRTVTVSLAEPAGSARHRWPGTITSLAPHGDAVRLLVSGAHDLLADVTPQAVTELGLAPGRRVWLSVKETAVRTYAAAPGPDARDR